MCNKGNFSWTWSGKETALGDRREVGSVQQEGCKVDGEGGRSQWELARLLKNQRG